MSIREWVHDHLPTSIAVEYQYVCTACDANFQEQWHDLLEGDISVREFLLQEHRMTWVSHVTVEYETTELDDPDDPAIVEFDIGESKLLTGCALQDDTPTQPMLFDGGRAQQLRKEMFTILRRLQERDADWRIDERFDHYQNALTEIDSGAFCLSIILSPR